MKSSTLPIYKEWVAQASPEQINFVDEVFYECEQHYDAGGDNVVETFEPAEILQQFKSLDDVREYCGLKVEQESNARWGEDSDPELKRLKDFDQWNNPDREIGERDDYFDENAARDQAGSSGGSLIHDEIERRALERDEYENEKYEKDQDGRPIDPPLPFTRNDGGNASFSSRWVHKNCKFAAWPSDTNYRNLAELELLLEEYGPDKLHDMIAKLLEEKATKPLHPGQRVIVKQRGQNLPGTFVRVYDDEYVVVKIDGYESKGNLYNPDNVTPAPNQLP